MVVIVPGMPCAVVLDGAGSPQSRSHWVSCAISGSWACLMAAASSLTCGLLARASAIFAIAIACWWCGIMDWAKVTSAWLWSAPGCVALANAVGVAAAAGRSAAAAGHQGQRGRTEDRGSEQPAVE